MRALLTDQVVAKATCPAGKKRLRISDTKIRGFSVLVSTTGTRRFVFRYGKAGAREETLGYFGEKDVTGTLDFTTAKARAMAESRRGKVRDKLDPVAERRAADAVKEAERAAAAYTVDRLIDDWASLYLVERAKSYGSRVPKQMRKGLANWLKTPAGELKRQHAVQVLDWTKRHGGPIAANRLHAVARACWNWAMKRGALTENPWLAIPRPSREIARERVLSDDELAILWCAADELDEPWRSITKLLMLTGQRRGEVAGMRWEELDLPGRAWNLPKERTKNGRSHTVPLAPEAIEILAGVRRFEGSTLVFEGPRRTVPSGFGKMKLRLDKKLAEGLAERGRVPAPWVVHDFRRTVATGFQRLGVRLEVTEAFLNHVSGSRSGIVGIYQRHQWQTEKVAAAAAWATHLMRCVRGSSGENVVPFVAAREA